MIADFHNDFVTDSNFSKVLDAYKKSDNLIVGAVFKGRRSFEQCLSLSQKFIAEKSKNLYLAYEDFTFAESFKNLEKLLDFKPFYVTLTWNGDGILGGGAGGVSGLTKRGEDVIKLLNERGIIIDVAHLNERTFYEVIERAENVVCSHTAFFEINAHKRNLNLGQLKVLNGRDAKVGLCLYPYFLTGTSYADVDDVFKHVDYFVSAFGGENLCIGTDFYGCECYPENMSDYSFENVLKEKLLSAGYPLSTIDGILFKNLMEILPFNAVEYKKIKFGREL